MIKTINSKLFAYRFDVITDRTFGRREDNILREIFRHFSVVLFLLQEEEEVES